MEESKLGQEHESQQHTHTHTHTHTHIHTQYPNPASGLWITDGLICLDNNQITFLFGSIVVIIAIVANVPMSSLCRSSLQRTCSL